MLRPCNAAAVLLILLLTTPANADPPTGDIRLMIEQGMSEALAARYPQPRSPEQLHHLAAASANHARRLEPSPARNQILAKTTEYYKAWIDALPNIDNAEPERLRTDLAAARVEFASTLLSLHAAAQLDRIELTQGHQGDHSALRQTLHTAHNQYAQAAQLLAPLWQTADRREDDLLALGIYETLNRLKLDIAYNTAWTNLYRARLEDSDPAQRQTWLHSAENRFRELLTSDQIGDYQPLCRLGLAIALRTQNRFSEAAQHFRDLLDRQTNNTLAAQTRYEFARSLLDEHKFDEARTILNPLRAADPAQLTPEQQPARFYLNLARLWHANSYLVEADYLQSLTRDDSLGQAYRHQARRSRSQGLAAMQRLADQGGPWPELVEIYVLDALDPAANPADLAPLELLIRARQQIKQREFNAARNLLTIARQHEELGEDLAGNVLLELGRCQHQLGNVDDALKTFEEIVRRHKNHDAAPQAATYIYQLRALQARQSQRPEDYQRLADALLQLLQTFPDHPQRIDAQWWLPVALQSARKFQQAAQHFGVIPESHPRWEDAQLRRLVCQREKYENQKPELGDNAALVAARRLAQDFLRYADQAQRRDRNEQSTRARLHAAEILAMQGIDQYRQALDAVQPLDPRKLPETEVARLLTVRMRAHRGLGEFDAVTNALESFLSSRTAEKSIATLSILAAGLQEEVERLLKAGHQQHARELAEDAVSAFERLRGWAERHPESAAQQPVITYGLARMLHIAGQSQRAIDLVNDLVQQYPRNGHYHWLRAQVLSATVDEYSSAADLKQASDAWARLLSDNQLRTRQPERYWEARYEWLRIECLRGNRDDVVRAIEQERVWYPNLGGAPWNARLETLLQQARGSE